MNFHFPVTLFSYGTLQVPEVLDYLLGLNAHEKVFQGKATLKDHQAFYVEGEGFPIVTKAPGEELEGILLSLNSSQWQVLCHYEDAEDYEVKEVELYLKGAPTSSTKALIFWPKSHLRASEKKWSLNGWYEKVDLKDYLGQIDRWMADF